MASFVMSSQSNPNEDKHNYSEVINGKKRTIHEEFQTYHHQLEAKETQICNQLDGICISENDKFNGSLQPTNDMIQYLSSQVENLQVCFQEKNMWHNVQYYIVGLLQVLEAKRRLEQSPPILSVKLTFLPNFRDMLDKCCNIEQISVFRYDPYPAKFRNKQTPNESIEALAIDPETNRLYALVKSTVSCIKVLNTDELTELVTFTDQKIMFPNNIALCGEFIFIVCDRSLLKLRKDSIAVIEIANSQSTFSGLAVNFLNLSVYVGIAEKLVINVHDMDLRQIKVIQLKTSEQTKHRKHTRIQHISIVQSELYVLFSNTNHPLQSYTLNGDVLRCIIPETMLKEGRRFCFDHHLNIFITDRDAHELKMFTNEGILIHKMGHEGCSPGNFSYPTGLAIDDTGSLFVTDGKDNAMIQKFVVKRPY